VSLERAGGEEDGAFLGGTGARRARELPAAELVRTLVSESTS
jgi:hypothetical protein